MTDHEKMVQLAELYVQARLFGGRGILNEGPAYDAQCTVRQTETVDGEVHPLWHVVGILPSTSPQAVEWRGPAREWFRTVARLATRKA